jgi:hypothetical protein
MQASARMVFESWQQMLERGERCCVELAS